MIKTRKRKMLECKQMNISLTNIISRIVEITEDYIDMYDVCNTDDGYL